MAFKIAYCAGHYQDTPGKRVPNYIDVHETREWVLNDRVADHFMQAASQYEGVELLRTDDPTGKKFIDIPERTAKANSWGADLYIDMHHNAGIGGGNGGGIEAFSYPGSTKGKEYRDAVYNAVIAAGGLKGNRANPLREKKFDSLSLTKMPAILMEYGYMDSRTDGPVILDEAYSKLVAYATMEGIAKIAGLKKATVSNAAPVKPSVPATVKSIDELAKEVIAGKHGTGAERRKSLGDLYDEVQARVNEILTGKKTEVKEPVKKPEKTIDELAKEVIDGKHGSGAARKKSLGDKYDAVQARVNEILTGKKATSPAKTIDQLAKEVIAGKHGTGAKRRASLGDLYDEVQKRVNELMK